MEIEEYRKFTKPAELHKAINTLKGMVAGITADRKIGEEEVKELIHWCTLHGHLRDKHPFKELLPMIEVTHEDGFITEEASKDIIWLCNNFISDASYYDLTTSAIQFLSGLIHGIMADGVLSDEEIKSLHTWLEANTYLKGCYPFDEIESLINATLEDGVIDEDERNMLMAFFSNFIDLTASYHLHETELVRLREQYSLDGICASQPVIDFENKRFCFTGESRVCKRKEIEQHIINAGGMLLNSVSTKVDYLVVGASGNPCWAYACYGRKIEEAVQLRKEGSKILIVHENDFWDAHEKIVILLRIAA